MLRAQRVLLATSCLALAIAVVACGGSAGPTAPSESAGATITGTVNGGQGLSSSASAAAMGPTDAGAPSGMTVSVVGTNLSAAVDTSGKFQIERVPPGTVQLSFTYSNVSATLRLSNVGPEELIQIQVNVSGTTATLVEEVRSSGKVSLCHAEGNGSYHLIDVSVSAEPAHRAHGDAKIGEPVPADTTKMFDTNCRPVGPEIRIRKSTNGDDANTAPGPTIPVGSAVTWQYVVTNTGNVSLTNVAVTDDRGVAVSCPQTTLGVGQSMTCTASGVATPGQYRNLGTAIANWSAGTVSHSDASHYFGLAPNGEEEGPKVQLCHRTGNGSYHLIEVSINAEPAHRAHGDGKIGEAVPNMPGKVFGAGCSVR